MSSYSSFTMADSGYEPIQVPQNIPNHYPCDDLVEPPPSMGRALFPLLTSYDRLPAHIKAVNPPNEHRKVLATCVLCSSVLVRAGNGASKNETATLKCAGAIHNDVTGTRKCLGTMVSQAFIHNCLVGAYGDPNQLVNQIICMPNCDVCKNRGEIGLRIWVGKAGGPNADQIMIFCRGNTQGCPMRFMVPFKPSENPDVRKIQNVFIKDKVPSPARYYYDISPVQKGKTNSAQPATIPTFNVPELQPF